MKSLDQYLIFGVIADSGSFAAAASLLGVSKSHISKQIAALEAQLGLRLVQRSSRRLQITEAGLRLLQDIRPLLAAYHKAEQTAAGLSAEPGGHIRLAINSVFTGHVLAPRLNAFIADYPGIHLELLLQQGTPDNLQDNIDAAITIGELPDSSYVSQRLGTLRACLVAAPAYLQRKARPLIAEDLASHDCLVTHYPTIPKARSWKLVQAGRLYEVPINARLTLNDVQVVKALVLNGSGIAAIPDFFVEQELRSGKLIRLLPDYHFPMEPVIYLVYHHRQLMSPGLQAVLEFIRHCFAEYLPDQHNSPTAGDPDCHQAGKKLDTTSVSRGM